MLSTSYLKKMSKKQTDLNVLAQAKVLAQELKEDLKAEDVWVLVPDFPSLSRMDFIVKLKPGKDLSESTWDQATDKVISLEWKNRDETGLEFYFYLQLFEVLTEN